MTNQTDSLYTIFIGGFFATIAFLLGGLDNLIIALALFMTMDYISGIVVAYETKDISSRRAFKGLLKKGAMISLVVIAHQLDLITGGEGHFIRNAMIFFLVGTEGISILENMGKLGVKVPGFIVERFEQLVDKHTDKGDEK